MNSIRSPQKNINPDEGLPRRVLLQPAETHDAYRLFEQCYDSLPETVKKVGDFQPSIQEKLMAIITALTILSALFTKVKGVYHQRIYHCNLYFIVLAKAASNKSIIAYAARLVHKIQDEILADSRLLESRYRAEIERYLRAKKQGSTGDPPVKPPFKVVLIPADTTSPKIVQHLVDNEDKVPSLMITSEIDVSTASAKANGEVSHLLRQNAMNETISLSRKGENQYLECREPQMAVVMSGTPDQVKAFIRNAEDGLASRFLWLEFDPGIKWQSVAPCNTCPNLHDLYDRLAPEYYDMWSFMKNQVTTVRLTSSQWEALNEFGESHLRHFYTFNGEEMAAVVKRHALMVFKLCMTLSGVRKFESRCQDEIVYCADHDFHIAMAIVRISLESSVRVIRSLPRSTPQVQLDQKGSFWSQLPESFERKMAIEVASQLKVSERTADRWIKSFIETGLLEKTGFSSYCKKNGGGVSELSTALSPSHPDINNLKQINPNDEF